MAKGPGVSIDEQANGRWRVRWREKVSEGGETRIVQRSKTVETQAIAIKLQNRVLECVQTGVLFEPDAREIPVVATVDAVFDGWMEAVAAQGLSQGSILTYGSYTTVLLNVMRELDGLPEEVQVPGTWLSREGVIRVTNKLREGRAESSVYHMARALVQAWVWACDDPKAYPGIAIAPRNVSSVLPTPPLYVAAPAPTMAECDAMLRRLLARLGGPLPRGGRVLGSALPFCVIARCTGLRQKQIVSLRVGDVDLKERELYVASGKSRREKVGRRVPLAPVLVGALRPLVEDRDPSAPLLLGRKGRGLTQSPSIVIRSAWEAATESGEVNAEVWKPKNRATSRPDHAFRAAFQAHLERQGVRAEIIDQLVGHAGSVRSQHYVGEDNRWDAMVDAVATLPPIDWRGRQPILANN